MASEGTSRDGVKEQLIDRLKADSDDKSIEDLLGCRPVDPPRSRAADLPDRVTDLLISHRDLFIDFVKSEAEARTQTHADLLSGSRSLDKHYENVVNRYQSEPSQTPDKLADKLTDMLTRVCHIMAVEDPLFSFTPVGVGSHHDGTKVSGQGDLDFVLVSTYRSGEGLPARTLEGLAVRLREGLTVRLEEGARDRTRRALTKRPRRGSMDSSEKDSSDRPLVDYRVEGCVDYRRPQFSIFPVEGSYLYKICKKRRLLDRGRLHTGRYRDHLYRLLSSAISGACSEVGLSFGGWNKPLFGRFEENGPAWTVVVDGVSVDITVAFKAPKDIKDIEGRRVMENVAEEVSSRVSSSVSSFVSSSVSPSVSSLVFPSLSPSVSSLVSPSVSPSVSSPVSDEDRPDYVNLALLVLSCDDYWELSTSLLESRLIRSVPELQSALKLCKVYKEYLFNLPWPDLTPFFKHLEERVFKWLVWEGVCDVVLGAFPSHPHMKVVNRLGPQAKAVLSLTTQSRPLTLDNNMTEKLEEIKKRSGKWIDYREVYPSLRSMIESGHQKPIIQTISYVFKSLVLEEWMKNKRITTQQLVWKVMEIYSERLKSAVRHPSLSPPFRPPPVDVVKSHLLCHSRYLDIKDSVRCIHLKNVKQIVDQISCLTCRGLPRHTPTTIMFMSPDDNFLLL